MCRVCRIAEQLSQDFYLRILHKGAGQLWGFCRRWVSEEAAKLLVQGGYKIVASSANDFAKTVNDLFEKLRWSRNKQAKLCRLYIIQKARSL